MNDRHTPGPWHATPEGYIASKHDGYVPIVSPFLRGALRTQYGGPTAEAEANARLIAAAPGMLEALNRIRNLSAGVPAMGRFAKAQEIAHVAIKAAEGDA